MNLLIRIALSALALLGVAAVVPGIHVHGFVAAVLAALALALVNGFLRPLIVLLTLPVTLITLGLFLLVVNAGMLLLTGAIVPGFEVVSWRSALGGTVGLWLIGMLINRFVPDEQEVHFDRKMIAR